MKKSESTLEYEIVQIKNNCQTSSASTLYVDIKNILIQNHPLSKQAYFDITDIAFYMAEHIKTRDAEDKANEICTLLLKHIQTNTEILPETIPLPISRNIGVGGWGIIKQIEHENKLYAMKQNKDNDKLYASTNELMHMIKLKNEEHIVQLKYVSFSANYNFLYLVMEYAPKNLTDAIYNSWELPTDTQKRQWMLQIALALHAMHNLDIIHRDLKPNNILIDSHNNVKVCDFGLSGSAGKYKLIGQLGYELGYVAPEIFETLIYDDKSDVYAWGMIGYEVEQKKIPYSNVKIYDREPMINYIAKNPPCMPHDFISNSTQDPGYLNCIINAWKPHKERPGLVGNDSIIKRLQNYKIT